MATRAYAEGIWGDGVRAQEFGVTAGHDGHSPSSGGGRLAAPQGIVGLERVAFSSVPLRSAASFHASRRDCVIDSD